MFHTNAEQSGPPWPVINRGKWLAFFLMRHNIFLETLGIWKQVQSTHHYSTTLVPVYPNVLAVAKRWRPTISPLVHEGENGMYESAQSPLADRVVIKGFKRTYRCTFPVIVRHRVVDRRRIGCTSSVYPYETAYFPLIFLPDSDCWITAMGEISRSADSTRCVGAVRNLDIRSALILFSFAF